MSLIGVVFVVIVILLLFGVISVRGDLMGMLKRLALMNIPLLGGMLFTQLGFLGNVGMGLVVGFGFSVLLDRWYEEK